MSDTWSQEIITVQAFFKDQTFTPDSWRPADLDKMCELFQAVVDEKWPGWRMYSAPWIVGVPAFLPQDGTHLRAELTRE